MTNRVVQHIRSNLVAYIALFVALGGTSYAAIKLPANSVGTRQIKNHAITPIKLDPSKTGAVVRFWAVVGASGNSERVVASHPNASVTHWDPGLGAGTVAWEQPFAHNCFALATAGSGSVSARVLPVPKAHASVLFAPSAANGQPTTGTVYIAVVCPSS
jgi:hypothetical protein